MDMDFDFLIFPKVEELDIIGPYEIFGKLNDVSEKRYGLHILAPSEITFCNHGLPLYRTRSLDQETHGNMLVVPGGKGVRESSRERTAVIEYIQRVHASYDLILTVCTGTFLLEEAGALKDKTCTTHSYYQDLLRKKGYTVVPHRIVHHGTLITSTGVTSGIDASLYVVAMLFGKSLAQTIIERIEYPFPIDHIIEMAYIIQADR